MLGRREHQKNQMVDGLAVDVVQGFLLSCAPSRRRGCRGLFRLSRFVFFVFLFSSAAAAQHKHIATRVMICNATFQQAAFSISLHFPCFSPSFEPWLVHTWAGGGRLTCVIRRRLFDDLFAM